MTHTRHARACSPPLSHGVLHLFLTLLLAYGAVASHLGRCEQLLPYGKLATSSFSYAKRSKTQEYYESAVVSSKNLCETRIMALYQHSCHEVQSSCNALSVKELQQCSAIGLLSQQRMKSVSAT